MIVLNEIKQAELVLRTRRINKKSTVTIILLAKYYLHYRKLDEIETYIEIDKFLKKNYPYYNQVTWSNKIKYMISKAVHYNLRQIDYIPISKTEISKIEEIQSLPKQRVLFTMLCLAKTYNATSYINNNWVNTSIDEILQSARVHPRNTKEKHLIFHELINGGYIEQSIKIDNINFRLTFISGDDEEMQISDLNELGYEWNNYHHYGIYGRCEICGRLYKVNKRRGKYCNLCAQDIKKQQDRSRWNKFLEFKASDFSA